MSSYDKVRGGSLSFKNGGSLAVKKKKKKKDKKASDEALELALEERRVGEGIGGAPGGDAKSGENRGGARVAAANHRFDVTNANEKRSEHRARSCSAT